VRFKLKQLIAVHARIRNSLPLVNGALRWLCGRDKRVSQLCLIRIDRNRYSVAVEWATTGFRYV